MYSYFVKLIEKLLGMLEKQSRHAIQRRLSRDNASRADIKVEICENVRKIRSQSGRCSSVSTWNEERVVLDEEVGADGEQLVASRQTGRLRANVASRP